MGYIGQRKALPILLEGLSHLEYRGYDSAGVACLNGSASRLFLVKEKGKLRALQERVAEIDLASTLGIGHTRWATHGEPSRVNAHPHTDCKNTLALVHNGIIENYESLKNELIRKGHQFRSETDTEVLVHLIEEHYRGDMAQALPAALKKVRGYFAFVLLSTQEPDRLLVFKRSNPLVIGLGKGETFIASDTPALLPYTRKVLFLEDDEYAIVRREKVEILSLRDGKPQRRRPTHIEWSVSEAQKGGYPHYMLKEIHEQPKVIQTILKIRLQRKKIFFDSFNSKIDSRLRRIKKIHLVSCGTAYHAGLVANYTLGEYAKIPVEATVSSEFRYEDPIVGKDDLVVLITQSGETADTLAALREAKTKRAFTLAIVNVVGSTIAREADCVIYTHAGPEIGVASTKAYCAQLVTLLLFSLYLANLRRKITPKTLQEIIREIQKIPELVQKILRLEPQIHQCARRYYQNQNFLYLGRGYSYPNALEGALKLKEITYAHAHGYPAGEMKHGPIALIDSKLPVICLAPRSKTYEKMLSNIEEIRARGGIVLSIGTESDSTLQKFSARFFPIPKCSEAVSPILTVIPLQIFAYQIAALKGRDVDQPRNLAKSVTVE